MPTRVTAFSKIIKKVEQNFEHSVLTDLNKLQRRGWLRWELSPFHLSENGLYSMHQKRIFGGIYEED